MFTDHFQDGQPPSKIWSLTIPIWPPIFQKMATNQTKDGHRPPLGWLPTIQRYVDTPSTGWSPTNSMRVTNHPMRVTTATALSQGRSPSPFFDSVGELFIIQTFLKNLDPLPGFSKLKNYETYNRSARLLFSNKCLSSNIKQV